MENNGNPCTPTVTTPIRPAICNLTTHSPSTTSFGLGVRKKDNLNNVEH